MLDHHDYVYAEFWSTVTALRATLRPGEWIPLQREALGALLETHYASGMRNDLFGLLEGLLIDAGLRGHVNQENVGYRQQVITILHRIVEGAQLLIIEVMNIAQDHTPPPQEQSESCNMYLP